ncbi:MAG TPA: hypothetical protein VFI25_01930 [Planctomycetota bacterium]|jgi:hypothetical protein|nr:hypothetical protein [Planctomycetota bacterium]
MDPKALAVPILAGLGALGLFGLPLAVSVGSRHEEDALLKALPKSKHSLAEGIQQVSKAPEVAISAKFEMEEEDGEKGEKDEKEEEEGELSLSVYTVEKGVGVDAEHNVLKEFAGSPEAAQWKPEVEVFKDAAHIARASAQLTLMALSPFSLVDIVRKAEKDQPGTVYSVTPVLRDRKPAFEVLVAAQGKTVELRYDLMKGDLVKPAK